MAGENLTHKQIRDGWFYENDNGMWPGQAMSIEVEMILFTGQSKYQDVLVFASKTYGTVLVLDGVIQCTERDEASYQEMISHIPLNSHPNPEKVLIIGGGDGGVVREVSRHPKVKQIVQCEIDQMVIDVAKKYLPSMSVGYSSPKLTLNVGDGFAFMKQHVAEFDVIITDSSDPVGPAVVLYEKAFFELMKKALKPGGIICSQGECVWLHLETIRRVMDFAKSMYSVVDYAYTSTPTYPSGQIGFILCSLNEKTNFREPVYTFSKSEMEELNLKYYNADVHRAGFVLPEFAKKALND